MKKLAAGILAVVVLVAVLVLGSGGRESACGAIAADAAAAADRPAVAGYSGDQLVNAAAIMNAAAALGLDTQAQTIGVMTAMGESSLRNITYGDYETSGVTNPDGSPTSSVGLFQQQAWWGTTAQRMDPTYAATLFFQRLATVPGWQQLTPSAAAHAVQRNSNPDHYTKFLAAAEAVVGALLGGDAACAAGVGGDAQALAQNLVTAIDDGRITGSVPNHLEQVRAIAAGRSTPGCGVDTRILQVMTIAYNTFGKLGVSSINRQCFGQSNVGIGVASAHYANGGGHAIDFYSLGGVATTGADANAIKLLRVLDPLMPEGSGAGQADCRARQGVSQTFTQFRQFPDYCNHLHIDVNPTGGDLLRSG